jgi:hypothetical protein
MQFFVIQLWVPNFIYPPDLKVIYIILCDAIA